MNVETLFEKFDLLAETPNAVEKMRELVLRLAFSGGLSGHLATDGVPEGWRKQSFEAISKSITPGFACSKSHQVANGHVHLRTHNISTLGTLNFDLMIRIDPSKVDPQKASLLAGDILFNNTNSQELVGKTSLVDRDYDYAFSNHLTRIRLKDGVFPGFVVYYLTLLRNSGHFSRLCTRWINQAAINTDTLKAQEIPLPPLPEQKRIVAKVDELMALCDRLESQQHERDAKHSALAHASIARFAETPLPASLPVLFHDVYAIPPAELVSMCLSLAIRGRLTPQSATDGLATADLDRARKRLGLAAWNMDEINSSSKHFDLPKSWCWVTVDAVATSRLGKMLDVEKNRGEPHPYLRNTNVHWFRFELDSIKTMLLDAGELEDFRVESGDVLICEGGHGIARAAVWEDQIPGMMFQKALHRVRPHPCLDPHFFTYCIRVYEAEGILQRYYTGAGIPHFTGRSLAKVVFPLPPVLEQRRIVRTVQRLMTLAEQMEVQQRQSTVMGNRVLEAVVQELFQQV